MKHLKEVSLRIKSGMEVTWPTTGITEPLNLTYIINKFDNRKVYSIGEKHRTIVYPYGGDIYVTPYTRFALRTLRNNKYHEEYVKYVPFDAADLPMHETNRWKQLVRWAEQSYREDFTADCLDYSKQNGIGRLSHITLKKCFEIPEEGLVVRNNILEEKVYPELDQKRPDQRMIMSYVGRFSHFKGLTIFIYVDGRTFVAKGYGIVRKLKRAGYQETGIFVPFSNGSLPIDKKLRNEWVALPSF